MYRIYFIALVPLTLNKSCFGSQYPAFRSIQVWSRNFGLEHRNYILGTQLLFKNEISLNRGINSQSTIYSKQPKFGGGAWNLHLYKKILKITLTTCTGVVLITLGRLKVKWRVKVCFFGHSVCSVRKQPFGFAIVYIYL